MQENGRFKRVYLHIGLGKTGTSSIQKYLTSNAKLLDREHDIHFPHAFNLAAPFDGNHSTLLRIMFAGQGESIPSQTLSGYYRPDEIENNSDNFCSQFEEGFANSTATQLLISAEAVGHFSKQKLLLLALWLDEYADSIEIIACIRQPAEALSSEIQQRLRFGQVLEDLYEKPPYYSFKSLLGRIETAFPDSKTILYGFEEAASNPLGVVGTFLQKIGVEMAPRGRDPRRLNPSMSQYGALLLSAFNRARPVLDEYSGREGRIPGDVAPFLRIPGRSFQAVPQAYERLEKLVEKDLIWLKKEHGLDLHTEPIERHAQKTFLSDTSLTRIALSIAALYTVFRRLRDVGKFIFGNRRSGF